MDIVLESVGALFSELELVPEIIVLTKIHPIDYRTIVHSVERTRKLFVIEEGSAFAGIGSEIIASVAEQVHVDLVARRIASLPVPIPSSRVLEHEVLTTSGRIIAEIKEAVS